MKRWRIVVAIIFIFVAFSSYVISGVYSYSLKTEQQALEASITDLQAQLDELDVKTNMLSSRESVKESHPELKYNDNVYYLEQYE